MTDHDRDDDRPDEAAPPDAGDGARDVGDRPIPLEPDERDAPGSRAHPARGVINKPSLLDGGDGPDACPNCGAPMRDPDAVFCVRCGYDLVHNRKATTKVGADDDAGGGDADSGDLCTPDKLGWKIPVVVGFAALVSAATLAGVHHPDAWLRPVVKVMLYGPIQVGLGVLAVIATARLLQQGVGRLEFALGRMALAVGLFYLLFHLAQGIHAASWIPFVVGAALGAGIYYLLVWLTFSLTAGAALMLGCAHFILWLAFRVMIGVVNWLESTPSAHGA